MNEDLQIIIDKLDDVIGMCEMKDIKALLEDSKRTLDSALSLSDYYEYRAGKKVAP